MTTDPRRILVLSDAHFGTPESSINCPTYASALVEHITASAPWHEIVFTGDLLDVNLSTFTRSIEGGIYPDLLAPLFGFRQFLGALDASMRRRDASTGLADAAGRWVYIPGNHDYKVWDILSTRVVCEDVLRSGKAMGSVPTPLRHYTWNGLESFFAGIFRTFNAHDRVVVTYPNHEALLGSGLAIFTHGHYLDPSQTWRNGLYARINAAETADDRARSIRTIFIETAQYQTAANAVSFTRRTRRFFNGLFGPEGLLNAASRLLMVVGAWILRLLFLGEASRGKAISKEQLLNIESYVTHFSPASKMPRWFIFGHTHRQDAARTPNLAIEVYNAGSFYVDRGMPMTFLEIEVADKDPAFILMCVDAFGKVASLPATDACPGYATQ